AEGEDQIASVVLTVFVGVEDELASDAVGGGAEDADVGDAVAVPVADHRLVAGLAEGERLAGVEGAVAVEVEVPGAVAEVADVGVAAAGPVAGHADHTGRAEVQKGLVGGGVEAHGAVGVERPRTVAGTIGA